MSPQLRVGLSLRVGAAVTPALSSGQSQHSKPGLAGNEYEEYEGALGKAMGLVVNMQHVRRFREGP